MRPIDMQIIDPVRNQLLLKRAARIADSPVTVSPMRKAILRAVMPDALERVLDKNDLFQVNWLTIGLRRASSVARIGGADRATGVLVSASLLLTNNHVLPSRPAAKQSVAYFNDELDENGLDKPITPFPLQPDRFFLTDEALDYTLVALPDEAAARFGFCQLIDEQGKARVGEAVTIIQHPSGGKKQIAFRSNLVTEILADYIRYETDTSGGSSGSPVFNDQWEMISLHHRSIARQNANGDALKLDGTNAPADTPDDEIDWIRNEGVRVSRILESVRGAKLDRTSAPYRDGLFANA
jgi:endonuclease G, mitochondrial